jgi:DNA repair photolyase
MLSGVPAPGFRPLLGREVLRERGEVRYFELQARSLLNRCTSPNVPFDWTVNPYRGCAIGCRYCYATYTHAYLGIDEAEAFHRVVYVKKDSLDETRRRLSRIVAKGGFIALGTVTDPYQPGETEFQATRGFLEAVAAYRNVRLGLTTKGVLILRDLDLLKRIHERSSLAIHFSLISMNAELLRRLEPWAPPPEVRVEAMRRLSAAGLKVSLSLAPILPGLTDSAEDLDELLARAARAGVATMSREILFLRSPTKEKYLDWLGREFPRYSEAYQRAYAGRTRLGGPYRQRILGLVDRLRDKHGLSRRTMPPALPAPPRQLTLWS